VRKEEFLSFQKWGEKYILTKNRAWNRVFSWEKLNRTVIVTSWGRYGGEERGGIQRKSKQWLDGNVVNQPIDVCVELRAWGDKGHKGHSMNLQDKKLIYQNSWGGTI